MSRISRKMWSRSVLSIAVVSLLVIATGCAQQSAPPVAPAPAAPAETKPPDAPPAMNKANWPKQVLLASAPKGGAWYPIAAVLSEIIKDATGSSVTIIEAGGDANVIAIHEGKAHLAMATVDSTLIGLAGRPPFEKPQTNVQGVTGLFSGLFQLAVPKNSDIMTFADMKGKRISCGSPGMGSINLCELVLKAYDLSFEDMARVEYVPTNDAGLMMKDRQLDALSPGITGYPVSTLIDLGSSMPLRLLPVSADALKRIQAKNPGYLPATLPANVYEGQTEPVEVFKTTTTLIASKDLPEDFLYTIAKALDENAAKLKGSHPTMKGFELRAGVEGISAVPIHPGVTKYVKEKGM